MMPIENPYQSPESDTRLDSKGSQGQRRRPTWRLVVLVLIGLPAVIGLLVTDLTNWRDRKPLTETLAVLSISMVVFVAYVVSCLFIIVYWRAPAQRNLNHSARYRAAFVQAGIWILTLIALPSAFLSSCFPIGIGIAIGDGKSRDEALIGLGVVVGVGAGIVGVILTAWLAYNLWLDALGRPAKVNPEKDKQRDESAVG